MLSMPTTTISILRGSALDEYGDDVDSKTPAYEHIPCSLLEQSRFVFDQSTSTPMTIRIIIGRVGSGTDIIEDDRVLDELTQEIYMVRSVSQVQNPFIASDIRLELKRISTTK